VELKLQKPSAAKSVHALHLLLRVVICVLAVLSSIRPIEFSNALAAPNNFVAGCFLLTSFLMDIPLRPTRVLVHVTQNTSLQNISLSTHHKKKAKHCSLARKVNLPEVSLAITTSQHFIV
jgi:hypothetical protein